MEVTSSSVYEAISVLTEVVIVFSIALMTRSIKALREAHYELLAKVVGADDGENKPLIRFVVWLSRARIRFPTVCLVVAIAVLGALAFSPATPLAQTSMLAFISLTFVFLMLFTFAHQSVFRQSESRREINIEE